MTIFFQIIFGAFLIAVLLLIGLFVKLYSSAVRLQRKVRNFATGGHSAGSERRRSRSSYRRRIIPPEYAVDVEYEVLPLSGKEYFIRISEVISIKGESQITEAEYFIIKE